MNAVKPEFDVSIVGAGSIGRIAAKMLTDLGLSVALLDKNTPNPLKKDARTFALNAAAKQLLSLIGIWDHLNYQPILNLFLAHEKGHQNLLLSHQQARLPALAYHVEHHTLCEALENQLTDRQHLTCFWEAEPHSFSNGILDFKQAGQLHRIKATLWLAADGSRSWLRDNMNMACTHQAYPEKAFIAKIKTTEPHHNMAYQKFSEQAILGCLPCPDPHELAIVLSSPNELPTELNELQDRLTGLSGGFFGMVHHIEAQQSHPLHNTLAQTVVKMPVVLIGDSAHQIHPLAGQGLNLALSDLLHLHQNIAWILKRRYPLNHPNVWAQYNKSALARAKAWNFLINQIRSKHHLGMAWWMAAQSQCFQRGMILTANHALHGPAAYF